jgi:hypothetical protein
MAPQVTLFVQRILGGRAYGYTAVENLSLLTGTSREWRFLAERFKDPRK